MRSLGKQALKTIPVRNLGIIFVFVWAFSSFVQSQSPSKALNPPEVLHWCAQHCTTWRLDKGPPFDKPHYGIEGQGSIVVVERFSYESVIMERTDLNPPGKATLRGKVSKDGNSIVTGTIEWTYHPCCGTGTGQFQAAWGSAINTVPGSDAEREQLTPHAESRPAVASNAAPAAEPAPPSSIRLPPGAAPQFASLPADLRAILQQQFAVLPSHLKLACSEAAKESSAEEALEIGRFAWRAAEFPRGYCWIKRSADLGNVRAKVLLGVAAGKGWGVPQDWKVAFQQFKSLADTTTDVWAAYFTEECYESGIGTPVNKAMAAHIDTWLMFRPEGQAMFLSIGTDDAEVMRGYERGLLLFDPPVSQHLECKYTAGATNETCYHVEEVNHERLQQELDEIDRKWATPHQ
jgi:hypothetical protein